MIKIHNVLSKSSYIAESINDCLDETDAAAYASAMSMREVICLGCVVAEPL